VKRRVLVVAIAVAVLGAGVVVSQGSPVIRELLEGFEEVPAVSTTGSGELTARINGDDSVSWQLTYSPLESDVTQAHIHFGQRSVNGGISVFLCSNLGNGPDGTQPCPVAGGTISGTFDADDVIGPAAQGIAAGEFDELLRAMRAGKTYVNIHTVNRPGGEVRSQIDPGRGHGRH
jgi:CHRD domain